MPGPAWHCPWLRVDNQEGKIKPQGLRGEGLCGSEITPALLYTRKAAPTAGVGFG